MVKLRVIQGDGLKVEQVPNSDRVTTQAWPMTPEMLYGQLDKATEERERLAATAIRGAAPNEQFMYEAEEGVI